MQNTNKIYIPFLLLMHLFPVKSTGPQAMNLIGQRTTQDNFNTVWETNDAITIKTVWKHLLREVYFWLLSEGPRHEFFTMEKTNREMTEGENAWERRFKWVFRPLNSWGSLEFRTWEGLTSDKDRRTENSWGITHEEVKMTIDGTSMEWALVLQ